MDLQSWPLFGLRFTPPRVDMRYVDDELAGALMELAATAGVHRPDFMPFGIPWTRFEPPKLQQQGMQHYWRVRAEVSADLWHLPFAVHVDGELVGVQDVGAQRFAVTRSVATGSWLALPHQGKGIGKEMRAAVLHLAFDSLGAEVAHTSAFADNPSSIGVTRSLGYRDNGFAIDDREGKPTKHLRFVLERGDWVRRDDITVEGVDACRELLGIPA
jgi:RimJ/RimL family protein N-acetyltransferase